MYTINYLLYFVLNISLAFLFQINNSDFHNDYVPRVINGHAAKLGDVPYQVAFKSLVPKTRIYATFCGGSIVAPTKLVTAAHCFVDSPNICQRIFCRGGILRTLLHKFAVAGNLRNRGYYSAFDSEETGQWRELKEVIFPTSYHFPHDDIAIVFIRSEFIYNSYVNYIPMASRLTDYIGSCLVSGFGRTSHTETSDKLLLANLDLLPMTTCNNQYHRNMRKLICTSCKVKDVGKGDSGGPLVCLNTKDPNEEPGKGVLVGVVSGNRYGVSSFFTRVSSYYRYIERNKSQKIYLNFSVMIIIQTEFLLF